MAIFRREHPSLTGANTYCMMDGHSSRTGSNLAARVNRAINDRPTHTAGRHLLSMVQAATNTERL